MIDNVLDYSFDLLGRNPFPVLLQKSSRPFALSHPHESNLDGDRNEEQLDF
jgi:hypothetical protein